MNTSNPSPSQAGELVPQAVADAVRQWLSPGDSMKACEALLKAGSEWLSLGSYAEQNEAPAQPSVGAAYKAFLQAEFGPLLGQDRTTFTIGNVARAFGAGASLSAPQAPSNRTEWDRVYGLISYWAQRARKAEDALEAKDVKPSESA